MNESEKRRPRSRKKEENIFMRPYQPKPYDYYGIDHGEMARRNFKKNYISQNNDGCFVLLFWFILSFLSGYFSSVFFISPPEIIYIFFIYYEEYTSNYELLCNIITYVIVYTPFFFFLLYKYELDFVKLSMKGKLFIICMIVIMFLFLIPPNYSYSLSTLYYDENLRPSRADFIREMVFLFGWLGISFYHFIILYLIVFSFAVLFNNGKGVIK